MCSLLSHYSSNNKLLKSLFLHEEVCTCGDQRTHCLPSQTRGLTACACNLNNKLRHRRVTPALHVTPHDSQRYLDGPVWQIEALAVIVFGPVARVLQLGSGAPLRFFDPFLTLMVHSSAVRRVLCLGDALARVLLLSPMQRKSLWRVAGQSLQMCAQLVWCRQYCARYRN